MIGRCNSELAGASRSRTEATPRPAERDVSDVSEDKRVKVVGVPIACADEIDRHLYSALALVELEITKTDLPGLGLAWSE